MGCNATMDTPRLPPLELRPSLRLAVLLLTAHAGALALLLMLPLHVIAQAIAALAVLASAAWSIRHHALRRGPSAVRTLRFEDRERLQLRLGDGRWQGGRIAGSSTVGPLLCILNVEHGVRAVRHVVIAGDALEADDLRRLRVWLRWGPAPGGEDTR